MNQELPDGRSNVVVLGGSRFVLSRILDESLPYLVALVQTFDDESDTARYPRRFRHCVSFSPATSQDCASSMTPSRRSRLFLMTR